MLDLVERIQKQKDGGGGLTLKCLKKIREKWKEK